MTYMFGEPDNLASIKVALSDLIIAVKQKIANDEGVVFEIDSLSISKDRISIERLTIETFEK